jgi:hypothetical protein
MARGHPGQIICETPISKISRAKWTGDVAQAVEHCKYKALSSNPSPTKKKKKANVHTPQFKTKLSNEFINPVA